MIELYLDIRDRLKVVSELEWIDMDENQMAKSSRPSAFILIDPVTWQQLGQDKLMADITFHIRVQHKPFRQTSKDAPDMDMLTDDLSYLNAIKKSLHNDEDSIITGISIYGENLVKKGEVLEWTLDLKGKVEYELMS